MNVRGRIMLAEGFDTAHGFCFSADLIATRNDFQDYSLRFDGDFVLPVRFPGPLVHEEIVGVRRR